ncbi:bifunctional DNA primase/polymerase [Spiractinospora alimapuensis]|uniref:bifunctional DNA primase/polymerase n=1 Tax=Spiractinospora alimapuensis TaxID=2820884 RepID=UPI001F48BD7E|nr:bifunctional DNA primase/polymerase [Spiractinospora alimapuensis]QVQ50620.1 bifunctional DNA primase/polymerase [Spiractinospora alimapuensis]
MSSVAMEYAQQGWPVARGAEPGTPGMGSCTCDRLGCPAPGAHPMSAAWALESTTDPSVVSRWWSMSPNANIILPTGRVFDVIDVPANLGMLALAQVGRSGTPCGPVAAIPGERYLFFVATRGAPEDENEWWTCHLDCVPETVADSPGLRWHCRDSYVVAPPSLLPSGVQATWIRTPQTDFASLTLPDPITILNLLADSAAPTP